MVVSSIEHLNASVTLVERALQQPADWADAVRRLHALVQECARRALLREVVDRRVNEGQHLLALHRLVPLAQLGK